MTDTTIADIAREKVVLDNTEWFEGQDGTGSFKSRIQSIRGTGVAAVTTSSVSQDVGPNEQLVQITSSGSGLGTDVINLISPALVDGVNATCINQVVIIAMVDQTNMSDVVHITVDGVQDSIPLINPSPGNLVSNVNDIKLTSVGSSAVFRWTGYAWVLDLSIGSFSAAGYIGNGIPVQPASVGGSVLVGGAGGDETNDGGQVLVSGGSVSSGSHNGGAAIIQAGWANGTGNGGDLTLDAGAGLANGHILIGSVVALPTADPHVASALWNNSGVLTISAG